MAKILLVEDDKSLREIYGVRLQAEGYAIISAGDGEEALAVAIKERPDLIVSDVMMPKISGFDMLDILRSTTETKDIKVIMMTALSSEDQRARGEALGADRYLVKSQVGIEDVVRTVHDVLGDGIPGSAPTPAPTAQPFTPAPAAEPAYTPPVAPIAPIEAPMTPAPAPIEVPVATPAPAPMAAPAPTYSPMAAAPVVPVAQIPTPVAMPTPAVPVQTVPTPLPAPTAPFSSNPPASLGDRIINPLPSANSLNTLGVADIAAQMNQELNTHLESLTPPAPAAVPAPMPAPTPTEYALPPQPPVPPLPPQPGV